MLCDDVPMLSCYGWYICHPYKRCFKRKIESKMRIPSAGRRKVAYVINMRDFTILSIHDTLEPFKQQLAEALSLGKEFSNAIINFIIKICFPMHQSKAEMSKFLDSHKKDFWFICRLKFRFSRNVEEKETKSKDDQRL